MKIKVQRTRVKFSFKPKKTLKNLLCKRRSSCSSEERRRLESVIHQLLIHPSIHTHTSVETSPDVLLQTFIQKQREHRHGATRQNCGSSGELLIWRLQNRVSSWSEEIQQQQRRQQQQEEVEVVEAEECVCVEGVSLSASLSSL